MKKGQIYSCLKCGNSVEVLDVGDGNLVCCGAPMDKVEKINQPAGISKDEADRHVILGIHITDRVHHAVNVQTVLSDFGTNIKTRLGLHEVHKNSCSPNGLIVVEFAGDDRQCDDMHKKLTAIEGVEVKRMIFDHP